MVMPVLMTHFVMLQRNLIYTGITRAKKICVLIGTSKALAYAIKNMTVLKRNTKLKERINPSLNPSSGNVAPIAYSLPLHEGGLGMVADEETDYERI